ncbi:hypothetical protein SSCG_02229 [Streptomyces clavuligerus]|nr:hypothetical protein SSCG_02229 [Streptomyces clavuligerus]
MGRLGLDIRRPARPTHDHSQAHPRTAGPGAPAHPGLQDRDNGVHDPVIATGLHTGRTHKPTPGPKEADRVHAAGRAPRSPRPRSTSAAEQEAAAREHRAAASCPCAKPGAPRPA